MRGLVKSLRLSIIVAAAILLVAVIIAGSPSNRCWVLKGVAGAATGTLGPRGMSSLVEGAIGDLDPEALAAVINDEETREALIELLQECLPELESTKVADLLNNLMADPELADLIVDVMAEIDEMVLANFVNDLVADPAVVDAVGSVVLLLEPGLIGNFINSVASEPALPEFISNIIASLDAEAMSGLLNEVLGSGSTADLVDGLIDDIDPEVVGSLFNRIIVNESTADLFNVLLTNLDVEAVSTFVNTWITNPTIGETFSAYISNSTPEGRAALADVANTIVQNPATVDLINAVVCDIDPGAVANFVNDLVAPEGVANQEVIDFAKGIIGEIDGTELGDFLFQVLDNKDFLDFVNELLPALSDPAGVIHDLVEGIKPSFWGDPGVDDAFLDYLWVEVKLENLGLYDYFLTQLGYDLDDLAVEILRNANVWVRATDVYYGADPGWEVRGYG